jgi:hypothetical protein
MADRPPPGSIVELDGAPEDAFRMFSALDPSFCPAWADGKHCYETARGVLRLTHGDPGTEYHVKRCACGAEVKRT